MKLNIESIFVPRKSLGKEHVTIWARIPEEEQEKKQFIKNLRNLHGNGWNVGSERFFGIVELTSTKKSSMYKIEINDAKIRYSKKGIDIDDLKEDTCEIIKNYKNNDIKNYTVIRCK